MLSWISAISGLMSDSVRRRRKAFVACAIFDRLINQRGLSGKSHIPTIRSRDGIAARPNIQRHPSLPDSCLLYTSDDDAAAPLWENKQIFLLLCRLHGIGGAALTWQPAPATPGLATRPEHTDDRHQSRHPIIAE